MLAKVLKSVIKQLPRKTKVITKLNSFFPERSVSELNQRDQD